MTPTAGWKTRLGDLLVKYEKLVGQGLVIANYFVLSAVLRRAWPGADRGTMLTLVGISSGVLAFAEVQWLQWLTGRHIAVLPPRRPTEWVVWCLIVACFVAAVWVTADERRAEAGADEQQRLNDEWDAGLRQTLNEPKVREGFRALEAIGERRAATAPATSRAASTRPTARPTTTPVPTSSPAPPALWFPAPPPGSLQLQGGPHWLCFAQMAFSGGRPPPRRPVHGPQVSGSASRSTSRRRCSERAVSQQITAQTRPAVQPARTSVG